MEKESSLINRSAVKKIALNLSTELKNGQYTRVSAQFIDSINEAVKSLIRSRVESNSHSGKTLE